MDFDRLDVPGFQPAMAAGDTRGILPLFAAARRIDRSFIWGEQDRCAGPQAILLGDPLQRAQFGPVQ